jgi:hypothetical protein
VNARQPADWHQDTAWIRSADIRLCGSTAGRIAVHETIVYSLFPPHVGMRQYWRNLESLVTWTRSEPHRQWWKSFLKDSGGTGFWHETYFRRGGMEAIYDDIPESVGFMRCAPVVPARGGMFGAEARGGHQHATAPVVSEQELYGPSA